MACEQTIGEGQAFLDRKLDAPGEFLELPALASAAGLWQVRRRRCPASAEAGGSGTQGAALEQRRGYMGGEQGAQLEAAYANRAPRAVCDGACSWPWGAVASRKVAADGRKAATNVTHPSTMQ